MLGSREFRVFDPAFNPALPDYLIEMTAMFKRCVYVGALVLLVAQTAVAVITAPTSLKDFLTEADYILVAKIESYDAEKSALILIVQDDLKGKLEFRRMTVVMKGDADAEKLGHLPLLKKRLAPEVPMVVFISREGKKMVTYGYTNGTWIQFLGTAVEKDRAVWTLTHGEPYLRKMYKGTTSELTALVKNVLAGKAKPPELNEKEEPGFGPELPAKKTSDRRMPSSATQGMALFGVIPTLGIAGPIAILALLFPTVFGGVLILFRQWTAFITVLSVNSTLYLLYWWKGAAWSGDSFWGSEAGLWFVMTLVALLCTMWAWRRQLKNLAAGADALETPSRTEYLILTILTVTCLGFVTGTWFFAKPAPQDIIWNFTLVFTAGILVGLIYKVFRGVFEVMIPMATEGVMLGTTLLGHVIVLLYLAGFGAGPAESQTKASATGGSSDASVPRFVGEKWKVQSKRGGLFVSSPLIMGDKVFAASAHPTFKFGMLYSLDLATGAEDWKFNDEGSFKQPLSSPFVANGKVYIGEGFHEDPNCKIYCVDAGDGKKIWEYQTTSQTEANPIVADEKIFTGAGNDGFLCLSANPADKGKLLWQFPAKESKGRLLRFGAGAVVEGGKVYAGTGVDRLQEKDKGETALFCLDASTGKELWKVPMSDPVWSVPVISKGQLFLGVGNGDVFDNAEKPAGALYCLEASTGKHVWKLDLPNSVLQRPSVDEHNIYFGCRDGCCYAVDRAFGTVRWKVNLGSAIVGTPALARSTKANVTTSVFAVSTKGRIVCLDPNSGLASWTLNLEHEGMKFIGAPAVAVKAVEGAEQRLLIIGGGSISDRKATLICLEDRVPVQ